ncbi:uncharacterized protein N7529_010595 [Penicillium soppii]|uniref:uncharacterized protein n=1 Tax=Penicillium soppii TaxID=69789 RepID=UPI00254887B1|nr:uncharacterized protein N7529_010595 [Penicillium soppii]KAJ5856651.1 hypothetical protein N7529_010595 [Penicillium soppii]
MSDLETNDNLIISIEDEVNASRGYTAALGNPKYNALDLLNNEIGGDTPPRYLKETLGDHYETRNRMNASSRRWDISKL